MKHKFLLKTMLLLCALMAGSVNVRADKVTYTFTAKEWTSASGNWTGTAGSALDSKGVQCLKSTTYTVTSPSSLSNISSIVVTYGTASKTTTSSTISIKVGSGDAIVKNLAGGSLSGATLEWTYSPTVTGAITMAVTASGASAYIKSVTVTYSTASGEETTTTIDASGITNTNKFVSTTAGSLSASVTYGSPASAVPAASVTWSGDDDDVATINATTGAVTLVGAGTVTFTATYAGVTDTYMSSSDTYEMTVTNEDPDIVTIWSEDFSTYDADDVPSGGTYSYACTNGGGTTKIYEESNAGGTSPELLVGKTSGTFSATVTLLHSTYGYSGDLTLKFKSNANSINVKSGTDGITVDGEESEGEGVSFTTKDTHTVTFKGVTTVTENITIVFTAGASNVRLDDIVLKGKQAELTVVATPSISPASGAVVSGTEVTLTCVTDGATIYYTTDGSTPTSSSTAYNPASKPTITAATTIKAIGIKAGLTNSSVASASYTIAAPCATPTFSVATGVVDKGTSVSLSCATGGATIYYTTNGTTPTTSSSVYSSAFTINASQTIKAIAAKDGYANSEVASATYTVRDYVNYPFSFDGGRSDIESTTGLTQSGLGTDYTGSPYLKFDNAEDYLILKTNAAPGELKYDILGNSFSGGTFRVQYSADGSSYTNLKSYTGISSSKTTETFTNIPATTRYIKWVYVTKSSGNVALGNIKLTGCEAVTIGSAGYTTYTTDGKVMMPDGVTAYIATAINTSTVHLEEVSKVPADEPIILKASMGTYYLPVITSDTDDVSANILEASDGNVTSDASYDVYALANKESVVGFYLVKAGVKVPEGKAYLKKATSPGAKEFLTFGFEDDADGINSLTPALSEGEEAIYNLAGQRLNKMQKGINIVNGKKIAIN